MTADHRAARTVERREVVIVGGGPAGAATAAWLARGGRDVLVLERTPAWRWRACGVFASPASVDELRRLGIEEATVVAVARPVAAMRVEVPGAPPVRLTYRADRAGRQSAVGFDRGALDSALLGAASVAGAEVRLGTSIHEFDGQRLVVGDGNRRRELRARVVVGADGIRSTIARSMGVARRPLLDRTALTYHVPLPTDWGPDARMLVFDGGYCGLAPVPGDRLNVGIVLGGRWLRGLRENGAAAVAAAIDPIGSQPCDRIEGAAPVGHRATRRAGDCWLLVGDAAGFLDPFTGEGLHRALVSARLAAAAIDRRLTGRSADLADYEQRMRGRFAAKDLVSVIVQGFLARPALFAYAARRLADRGRLRETMSDVMGDLVPATRAIDPRFLAALLRP
jgi:flavin-dependent dehydrogenase